MEIFKINKWSVWASKAQAGAAGNVTFQNQARGVPDGAHRAEATEDTVQHQDRARARPVLPLTQPIHATASWGKLGPLSLEWGKSFVQMFVLSATWDPVSCSVSWCRGPWETERFLKYVAYNSSLLDLASQQRSCVTLPETTALKTKHPPPPEIWMISVWNKIISECGVCSCAVSFRWYQQIYIFNVNQTFWGKKALYPHHGPKENQRKTYSEISWLHFANDTVAKRPELNRTKLNRKPNVGFNLHKLDLWLLEKWGERGGL